MWGSDGIGRRGGETKRARTQEDHPKHSTLSQMTNIYLSLGGGVGAGGEGSGRTDEIFPVFLSRPHRKIDYIQEVKSRGKSGKKRARTPVCFRWPLPVCVRVSRLDAKEAADVASNAGLTQAQTGRFLQRHNQTSVWKKESRFKTSKRREDFYYNFNFLLPRVKNSKI